jgi:hypothetical protein
MNASNANTTDPARTLASAGKANCRQRIRIPDLAHVEPGSLPMQERLRNRSV